VVVDEAIHSSRELPDTSVANQTGRPVFCPYGTGSTNPSSGGFIYGGYLRTHNIIGARNAALKAQQRRRRTGAEAAPSTPQQATAAAVTPTAKAGTAAALRAGKQAIKSAPTPAAAAAAAAQKGALAAQQQAQDKKAAALAAVEKAKKSVAAAAAAAAAATGAKAKQAAAKAKQTAAAAAATTTAAAVDTAGLPKDTRPPEAPPATVEPPLDPAEAAELDALINPPYGVRPVAKDFAIIAQVVAAGKPTPRSDHVPDCLNFSLTGSSTSSSGSAGVLGRRTSRVAWAPTQVLTQDFARGG
jgi:hypothetical protein